MDLKVMVVDDTVVYRKLLTDVLGEFSKVEVVGSASNGKIALSRIDTLKPDLITLDVEMPVMDGVQTLEEIQKRKLDIGVIMISSLTKRGSDVTMKALELGAFDFIAKPDKESREENKKAIKEALAPRINHFLKRWDFQKALKGDRPKKEQKKEQKKAPTKVSREPSSTRSAYEKSEIVAIGVSTGGPNALTKMLPSLPDKLGVPVVVVQHMPPVFTKSLAESLDQKCSLRVQELRDGEALKKDTIYIAPGGYQSKIVTGANQIKMFRVLDDPPENNCKPSVDYMFRSVAREYQSKVTGVIMTGMGNDGTLGLKVMKSFGAVTIGQDENSCVVYGMPKIAIESGVVDIVVPLDKIASEISSTVKR